MSEEKKIKVVLLEPGKLARTAEIGTSIEDLQNAVDGLIEPFYPFEEQVCMCVLSATTRERSTVCCQTEA